MKRLALLLVSILLVLSACNLNLVREVNVKGTPEIQAPAGKMVLDLSDIFDIEELLKDLEFYEDIRKETKDGQDYSVIDFAYKLVELDFDEFGDFSDFIGIDPIGITKVSFDVPDADQDFSETQVLGAIDVPAIDLGGPYDDLKDIPEVDGEITETLTVDSSGAFTSMTFSEGSLEVEVAISGTLPSDGVTIEITSSYLKLNGENIAATGDSFIFENPGDTLTLTYNLADKTLTDPFDIEFTFEISDAGDFEGTGETFDLLITPTITDGTKITAAQGVTLDPASTSGTVASFDLDNPDPNLIGATIGEGSIEVGLTLPDWDNVEINTTDTIFTFVDANDEEFESAYDPGKEKFVIDLATAVLDGFTFSLKYDVHIQPSDDNEPSNIDLGAAITVAGDFKVVEFSTLKLVNADLLIVEEFEFPGDGDDPLPDMIKSVLFEISKITFAIDNQLPVDLEITIESAQLLKEDDKPSKTLTFTAGTNIPQDLDLVDELVIEGLDKIEITVTAKPSTFDDADSTVVLSDVNPGTAYSIEGNVTPVLDIFSVTLDVDESDTIGGNGDDVALDFSFLDDMLPTGVELKGITADMIISGVDDFSGEIVMLASYDGKVVALLGTYKGAGDISDVDNYDGEPFQPDVEVALNEDALVEFVNDKAEDIVFSYSIKVPDFTVEIADKPEELLMELAMAVPLHFYVTEVNGVHWDFGDDNGDVNDDKDDLFGRESADDDMNNILKQVEFVKLTFDMVNEVGMRPEVRIVADDWFDKRIALNTGKASVELTSDDIQNIIDEDNFPFIPEIKLYLLEGDHYIDHEGSITLEAQVEIGFDINYSIPLSR